MSSESIARIVHEAIRVVTKYDVANKIRSVPVWEDVSPTVRLETISAVEYYLSNPKISEADEVDETFEEEIFRTIVQAANPNRNLITFPDTVITDNERYEWLETQGYHIENFKNISMQWQDDLAVGVVSDENGNYFLLEDEPTE